MSAPSVVDQSAVNNLIDGLRRAAELSIAKVNSTISTAEGKRALAAVVAGYYNLVNDLGKRIVLAHLALGQAMANNPSAETQAQFARSVQLLTYWTALAQGFAIYTREATPEEQQSGRSAIGNPIAAAAVVVAVAGAVAVIAVSITGVAWAVVHYEQATNLGNEVALLEKNPATAEALAKINAGGGAGPSAPTLPGSGGGVGMVLGGLAVLGVVGTGIYLVTRK